ncbi:hypothetical protein LNP17_19050 [Klebsiella variicola subsp. variicola]|nr:hypothetical protein [Klebsiella variicola subsp. variicola]
MVVAVCAAVESDIAELDDADRDEFMAELGPEEPAPQPRDPRRLRAAEFCRPTSPLRVKEVRAWTIPVGANRAAGSR